MSNRLIFVYDDPGVANCGIFKNLHSPHDQQEYKADMVICVDEQTGATSILKNKWGDRGMVINLPDAAEKKANRRNRKSKKV